MKLKILFISLSLITLSACSSSKVISSEKTLEQEIPHFISAYHKQQGTLLLYGTKCRILKIKGRTYNRMIKMQWEFINDDGSLFHKSYPKMYVTESVPGNVNDEKMLPERLLPFTVKLYLLHPNSPREEIYKARVHWKK